MTLKTRLRIPAAQNARVADQPPSANEGAGNAGCAARTHGPVYKSKKVHEPQVTTGQAATPAFPARWFYGFLRALPGDRAFLPPSPTDHLRQLDASVGASGPHDFAVRLFARSSVAPQASTASRANVRDDRPNAPLIGHGTGRGSKADLPDEIREIFLRVGLDSRLSVDLVWKFGFLAQPESVIPGRELSERARN